jgi:hypothetical protein
VNEADLDVATAKIQNYHREMAAQINKRKPYRGTKDGSNTGQITNNGKTEEKTVIKSSDKEFVK